jgi:hypothetical protein
MKNSVIASQSRYVVITTIVFALLYPIFFEMDNAYGAGANFVVVNDNDNTMMTSSQQQEVEAECESPCPSSAEMCIEMCA